MRGQDLLCHRCGYRPPPGGGRRLDCPNDGLRLITAAEHEKSPRDGFLGSTLGGKYVIVGLLGAGGMGSVYRALQEPVNREVAVKTILPAQEEREGARVRFEREARIVARLTHPNTVRLFDYGVEADGTLYMVQELVEGRTLAEVVRAGPLDPMRVARIAVQGLGSLSEAHALGLVHRDIKPDNPMLVQTPWGEEQVKVLDFGIVKTLAGEEGAADRLTRTGMIIGTPQYMSPEQAKGEPLDGRSDQYSFGVVLHHLLSGSSPFDAPSIMVVLVRQVQEPPPPLPQLVPPPMAAVVLKAMEKRPEERFPDVAAMSRALQGAAGLSMPVAVRSDSQWAALAPTATLEAEGGQTLVSRRSRSGLRLTVGLVVGLALALLLVAGGLAVWVFSGNGEGGRDHGVSIGRSNAAHEAEPFVRGHQESTTPGASSTVSPDRLRRGAGPGSDKGHGSGGAAAARSVDKASSPDGPDAGRAKGRGSTAASAAARRRRHRPRSGRPARRPASATARPTAAEPAREKPGSAGKADGPERPTLVLPDDL